MTDCKRVNLAGSALFRLTSPDRLARQLNVTRRQFDELVEKGSENYRVWSDRTTNRLIEEPKPLLKKVHARVAYLLSQIETPTYLHSGVRGRSYFTNAGEHSASGRCITLDVKKFFPSVRAAAIYHFFRDVLEYPDDVASRMTSIMTIHGHLPTGGNASVILSFWAYKPMFDEIARLAAARNCSFSLYVDDISITGDGATRALQREVRAIIGRYRLRAHKGKVIPAGQAKVLTGIAVTTGGIELPHRRSKAVQAGLDSIKCAETDAERIALLPRVVGQVSEAATVDSAWMGRKASTLALARDTRKRVANARLMTPTAPAKSAPS